MSFLNKKVQKKSKSLEILGCSIEEFRKHIEFKFESWMNWGNYGYPKIGEKRWCIDHIVPISLAKTEEDIIKLNHYSNFQPMDFIDNIKKSNKLV